MSLDRTFIRAVIERDGFAEFKPRIPEHFFSDPGAARIWTYLCDYHSEYAKLPSLQTLENQFEGLVFPAAPEEAKFYYDLLEQKYVHAKMSEIAALYSQEAKSTGDYKLSLQKLYERISDVRKDISHSIIVTEIEKTKLDTWDYYLSSKAGEFGIPTPWETMNKWTRGFYPKDLSFLVGRTGLGKSWMMLLMAQAARRAGKKVMIISCEMSREDMQHRFFCIEFKIPYGPFRSGHLGMADEIRLKEALETYQPDVDVEIQDGSQGLGIQDIEACIMKTEADLILIDSAYRIRPSKKTRDRFEAMASVADDIKLFAQLYQKAIVCSMQLNRGATQKKTEDMGTEDIALSDVIAWNATNILAIGQEKNTENDRAFMKVMPLKVREGQNGKDFLEINWNFSTMDFSEVDENLAQSKPLYSVPNSRGRRDLDDDVDDGRW